MPRKPSKMIDSIIEIVNNTTYTTKEILTQPELCMLFRIKYITAWRWRKKGMPYIGKKRTIRYRIYDVIKWLKTEYNV